MKRRAISDVLYGTRKFQLAAELISTYLDKKKVLIVRTLKQSSKISKDVAGPLAFDDLQELD